MRLVTRSDFDGLVCAALLVDAGVVDEYKFVHPKDVQDGKIDITDNDVLANIPFDPACGLWFDHHSSEQERLRLNKEYKFTGVSKIAPSCATVVYEYYGGKSKFSKFDQNGLMSAVEKSDSALFTLDDILYPSGWELISFIVDPRTGLGRYGDYRISNYQLMLAMIEYFRNFNAEQILQIPDVIERVNRYFEQEKLYEEMIRNNSTTDENVLIIELQEVEEIYTGNRFKEYAMYPDQNVSVKTLWGFKKESMVISCGHSITNKTANSNIGSIMLAYGGGGHRFVGTCQVKVETWKKDRDAIVNKLIACG